jgi:uncharacterized alkaline shock family protein YloU
MTEPDTLDGHTIEELSDYLDRGREPRDESIERSPGCQIALESLARLRASTWAVLEAEAQSPPDDAWLGRVMAGIARETHAGRDIPITGSDERVTLAVSEGSVRGLVRAAGDGISGALVGSCTLVGDVTVAGEPIDVNVTVSIAYGENLRAVAEQIRERVAATLALHTELGVRDITVTVSDVHPAADPGGGGS